MKYPMILAVLALVAVSLALGAAGPAASPAPAPSAPGAYTEDVFTQPSKTIALAAAVGGIIKAVDVDEGAVVKAGDPIIRLDDSIESIAIRVAKLASEDKSAEEGARAKWEQAKYEYEAVKALSIEKVETELLMHQKKMAVDVTLSDYETAKKVREKSGMDQEAATINLARRTIRAPMGGVIIRMPKEVGEAVQPLETVGQLSVTDPLFIIAHPPARLLGTFRVGQSLEVEVLEPKRQTVTAKVGVVNAVVEPASNTFRVRLVVPNGEGRVPAGVKVRITVAGAESLTSPAPGKL